MAFAAPVPCERPLATVRAEARGAPVALARGAPRAGGAPAAGGTPVVDGWTASRGGPLACGALAVPQPVIRTATVSAMTGMAAAAFAAARRPSQPDRK